MNTYMIKIVKSESADDWYHDLIGYLLPLVREESDCYLSRDVAGYIRKVNKEDAEVVYDEAPW